MTGCQARVLVTVVSRQHCRQPEQLYRHLRDLGTPHLQFVPLQEQDNPESVTDREWGGFLMAVFDVWVREDIGRVFVQLFELTLGIWRGNSPRSASFSLTGECLPCPVRLLCGSDGPTDRAAGKSGLCAGYQAFFRHSAPHMRVMRDLMRHHRSPIELMALLRQSRQVTD